MKILKANFIFDGEKFLKENAVVLNENKIVDVIYIPDESLEQYSKIDLLDGILVPGFVNAHCHLELSYLQNIFSPQCTMTGFLKQMISKRNSFSDEEKKENAKFWDNKMFENGIVVVGDIVNSTDTLDIKVNSPIKYQNFVEVFGLSEIHSDKIFSHAIEILKQFQSKNLKAQLVPHAPYSLSENLWKNLLDYLIKENSKKILSFHFFESNDEKEILEGIYSNSMFDYFSKELNYSDHYLKNLFQTFWNKFEKIVEVSDNLLLVHNTYLNTKFLYKLKNHIDKIYFCLCPNANLFIESKLPDLNLIQQYSDKICLGTDSLASNNNLSIIDEINTLLNNFDVSIENVLKFATSNGAKALGLEKEVGYIKKNYSTPFNLINIKEKSVELKKVIKY